MPRIFLVLVALLIIPISAFASSLTQALQPNDTLSVSAQSCDLSVTAQSPSGVTVACGPQWTPTAIPSTATPLPTATVLPTATATSTGGVPACSHHANTYHGLVERDSSGAITCTYGHTHFDDPHALDYFFGPLPVPEISYPWATTNENAWASQSLLGKHAFYKWAVYDGACSANNATYGLRRFRLEAHADGNTGATVRYHSYFLQAEVCQPSNPSVSYVVTVGGHMDYGSLFLLEGSQEVYVPTAGDDGGKGINRRIHGSPQTQRPDWTWYGHHYFAFLGLRQEDWGPVDPNNLSRQLFYANPNQNHSFQSLGEIVSVIHQQRTPAGILIPDSGVADRYGTPVTAGCTPGPDCIPFSFGGLPLGANVQYTGTSTTREYDVQVGGVSLIQFPN